MVKSIICNCCGKTKTDTNYYNSPTVFNAHTGKYPTCKTCIWNYEESTGDYEIVKDILRMLDRPFLVDLWKSTEVEVEQRGLKSVFKTYMKNIAMPQYRDLNWTHSQMNTFIEEVGEDVQITSSEKDKLVEFFGKGFTTEEYIWLQDEYIDWCNRYDVDTKALEITIVEICITRLGIRNGKSNSSSVDKLQKTLIELMTAANLKPVQETGSQATEQETYGTLIKKFENEKPIPKPSEKWADVDGIKKYITVWFTGHLMKMMGKQDGEVSEIYEEEIAKLTVEEDLERKVSDEDDGDL